MNVDPASDQSNTQPESSMSTSSEDKNMKEDAPAQVPSLPLPRVNCPEKIVSVPLPLI